MKKVLIYAAVCLFVLALCSCGSSNTPEAVATKAIQCIIDKNYEGYVDLMYFKKEKSSDDMKQIVALVKDKMDKELDQKQGIKDFDVEPASIDGDKATVSYKMTYGNGETKEDTMKLIKTEKGEWMIDSGK
jgi:hypothetical protein